MSWVSDILGNTLGQVVESVGKVIDMFVTTDEDKLKAAKAKMELELTVKRMEMEVEQRYFEDRASAREMYMKDSGLQKTFAITFLVGYLLTTGFLIWMVMGWLRGVDLPDWGVMLISAVFTAMSTKVNTIVDFLFGSSQSRDDSDKMASQAVLSYQNSKRKEVLGPPAPPGIQG